MESRRKKIMGFNPFEMKKYKERLDLFNAQHPKVGAFLAAVGSQGAEAGTVIEMKVTRPDGRELVSNIRLTEDDVETIHMLHQIQD
jgi:hypothetical protein